MRKRVLVLLLCVGISVLLKAPAFALTEDSSMSVEQLAASLLGNGITTTNVVSSGTVYEIGGAETELGIDSGVVLDTSGQSAGDKDPDLEALITAAGKTYGGHTSTLQFTMAATGTLLNFNYVFASREFDQSSTYNDIFGLFVKVNDGAFENIALLDNGKQITISNLRAGRDGTQLNSGESTQIGSSGTVYDYFSVKNVTINGETCDGVSNVFNAQKTVNVGDTVTVKFVIADVGDTSYNSYVAIQAGSLSFDPPHSNVDYEQECLTGLDVGATYEITEGETQYTFTADENGAIPLSGTYNGTAYDFIGKQISVVKKGSGSVADSDPQTVIIADRPAVPGSTDAPGEPTVPTTTPTLDLKDISTTDTSVTVTGKSGCEYSIDGTTWVKPDESGKVVFSGLTQSQSPVTVYTRVAATETAPCSNSSAGIAVSLLIPLTTPSSLSWNGRTAAWSAVNNAQCYAVQLFNNGTAVGDFVSVVSGTSNDFSEIIVGGGIGTYTFKVIAVADGETYINSPLSDASAQYVFSTPTISSPAQLPAGTIGLPYSQTLTADGTAPIVWSIKTGNTLPAGLTLNGETGEISGIPTTTGTFSFTVIAQNDAGSVEKAFSISVSKQPSAVAPGAPMVTSYDSTEISINTVEGEEYYISTGSAAPSTWPVNSGAYFIASVDGNHTFTGLNPATKYYIYVRTAETDIALPSQSTSAEQCTIPTAPDANVLAINYAAETISFSNIYEVSTKNDETGTAITGAITPTDSEQTVYVRVKAANGVPASEWTAVTIPARPAIGVALSTDINTETVTVPAGYSYKVGTGSAVSVSTDTTVTLAPGAEFTYWKTPTGSAFKSNSSSFAAPVRSGTPASPAINGANEAVATAVGMQYKIGSGNWADCTENMKLADFGWNGTSSMTISFREKAAGNNYASDSVQETIPARANAPVAGKTNETIDGKNDGSITAVSDAMEYQLSTAESWTDVPNGSTSIANLSAGTYRVRVKATNNTVCSQTATIAVAAGSKMTLTFDEKGGTDVSDITDLSWQNAVAVPTTTRTGYTFGGWNTQANGNGAELTGATKTEASRTYYAIWTANSYKVTFHANGGEGSDAEQDFTYDEASKPLAANTFDRAGHIFASWNTQADGSGTSYKDAQSVANLLAEDHSNLDLYAQWTENTRHNLEGVISSTSPSSAVSCATVSLKQGNETVAATTSDDQGHYSFTNLLPGFYDLVVAKDGKSVTALCFIEKADSVQTYTQNAILPLTATSSSTLIVQKESNVKTEVPKIVVGGLESVADTQSRDIVMTITQETQETDNTEQIAIKNAASQQVSFYLNVSLTSGGTELSDSGRVLELLIPYDFAGKTNVRIWRYHDSETQEFTQLSAKPTAPYSDKTFYADTGNRMLHIYAQRFSTYAVSYTPLVYVTEYTPTIAPADNGTVSVSPTKASSGQTVTITPKPDSGYKVKTVTVKDQLGNPIKITANENGTYSFIQPSRAVQITVLFTKNGDSNPFSDVSKGSYYYDAVIWAADEGVANGTSSDRFSPDGICTRAQAITSLWRAMGSPAPTTAICPFTDVNKNAYYYKAVLWATEKGITEGTSATTFTPDATVTRAQTMTLQWRAAGKPVTAAENPFADVRDNAYYANAVLWAVSQKITDGTTATTFSPASGCSRAQFVIFLYRYLGK